jgi:hypothetical protein
MIQYEAGEYLMRYFYKECVHKNSELNTKVAVIVETRDAFFFPLVIKNVVDKLGPTWNIHLFIVPALIPFIEREFPKCVFRITKLDLPYPTRKFGPSEYSRLLRGVEFWNHVKEEGVLIFQTDSLLLRGIPAWVEAYDMIGAPCGINLEDKVIFNGGLSWRSRRAMLSLSLDDIANEKEQRPEDVFFTEEMRALGDKYKLPNIAKASEFASETLQRTDCIGIHATDKYYIR